MKSLRPLIGAALLMTASVSAHAYTECPGRVIKIFADSSVYVWFDNGLVWQRAAWYGSGVVELQSQATVKNIVALATVAMTTGRPLTVRFTANGVSCSGDQQTQEVWGVYLSDT
ncbi:hypothetical protein GCM10011487_21890 [Steroidobacter agaridevorans]|uniref:Uncharacterized protein n=1 Tax=Steroidobacter agaridevorans TaxID=2695856 RepID=A0A829YA52_9GAMM|nr:hypothetical protein GCM10011487_21890 [Steroidobacter agaridevorans]GFE89841.1 hypothetical protein GCM10011488_47950 [Steroidobacter agaridevorans]